MSVSLSAGFTRQLNMHLEKLAAACYGTREAWACHCQSVSCQNLNGACYTARQYELTPMCVLAYFDCEIFSTWKGGQAQGTGHKEGQ